MTERSLKEQRVSRWYFGGLASAGAACCTHPLDLLKVLLQTQQEGKVSLMNLTVNIVKKQGTVDIVFYSICLWLFLLIKVFWLCIMVSRHRSCDNWPTQPPGSGYTRWLSRIITWTLLLRKLVLLPLQVSFDFFFRNFWHWTDHRMCWWFCGHTGGYGERSDAKRYKIAEGQA